jgi:dihydrofolate reductase
VTELGAPATTVEDEQAELDPLPGLGLIVAVGRDGAIGRAGGLPWHAPEDLRHFRRTTTGNAVILGATTWHSINRALPDRQLIVVTSRELTVPEGVLLASDPESALAVAFAIDASPLVAGGSRLYEALLPSVVRVHLTDIDIDVEGADAFFPSLDASAWIERRSWPGTDERLTFRILDRLPRADGMIRA